MDKRECHLVQIEWVTDSDRLSRRLSHSRHSSRGLDTTLCDQDALTGTADAYKKDRSVAELGTWRWTYSTNKKEIDTAMMAHQDTLLAAGTTRPWLRKMHGR